MKGSDIIIKVCGLRDAGNISAVSALDIDMTGFIFYPRSKRYVRMLHFPSGTLPDCSEERMEALRRGDMLSLAVGKRPQRVGVFVDDMPQNIITRIYNYDLDWVQLHGEESPVMIENLRRTVVPDIRKSLKIMKAISVRGVDDVKKAAEYEGVADMLLFDTKCKTMGGSGDKFDWDVLATYDGKLPFLLSGGIGPDDVARLSAFSHPRCAGIDLNSRFESAPGVKDVERLGAFVESMRKGCGQ